MELEFKKIEFHLKCHLELDYVKFKLVATCYSSLVHSSTMATILDLSFFFFSSLALSFVSYSSRRGFLFFLSFVRVMWDGRPQLLTYLFIYFFFLLFKHRQIVFSAFSSVSYSSRCGFLFFLSFVRVMWDGRPQLLTYLIFFLSLFNHRQIVLSQETLS